MSVNQKKEGEVVTGWERWREDGEGMSTFETEKKERNKEVRTVPSKAPKGRALHICVMG